MAAGGRRRRSSATGWSLDGKTGYAATAPLANDAAREDARGLGAARPTWTQRGGGVLELQTLDGGVFDAIVFGEQEPGRWMAGSDVFRRTTAVRRRRPRRRRPTRRVHVAIIYHADGTITGYRDGQPYGKPYRAGGPVELQAGAGQRRVRPAARPGRRQQDAGGHDRCGPALRPGPDRRRGGGLGRRSAAVPEAEIVAQLTRGARGRAANAPGRASRLATEAARLESPSAGKVYAVTPRRAGADAPAAPGRSRRRRGAVVPPGGVAALSGRCRLRPDSRTPPRASAARRWPSGSPHPDNPLFARVIVNRLWHHHFGPGLVETPSDFGFNGGRPRIPSCSTGWPPSCVAAGGWSLKAHAPADRHRRPPTASRRRLDPAAARGRRRQPAALAADAAAAGGRGGARRHAGRQRPARPHGRRAGLPGLRGRTSSRARSSTTRSTQVGPDVRPPHALPHVGPAAAAARFLDAFDCPDPSATTPRRHDHDAAAGAGPVNNAFVLRPGRPLRRAAAARGRRRPRAARSSAPGGWPSAGRRDPDERELPRQFVEQHGLAALCRVLFNSNEFLYVRREPGMAVEACHATVASSRSRWARATAWAARRLAEPAAAATARSGRGGARRGRPTRRPHFAPKAKRVIHICLCGGLSHVDSFDYKPELAKYHGKPLPGEREARRRSSARSACCAEPTGRSSGAARAACGSPTCSRTSPRSPTS